MSLLRALSGEIYSTRTPRANSGCRHSASRHARNAANVLPEPVGARMSVCCPAAIAGQPSRCGAVGSPSAVRNQCRTGGRNRARGSGASMRILYKCFLLRVPEKSASVWLKNGTPLIRTARGEQSYRPLLSDYLSDKSRSIDSDEVKRPEFERQSR